MNSIKLTLSKYTYLLFSLGILLVAATSSIQASEAGDTSVKGETLKHMDKNPDKGCAAVAAFIASGALLGSTVVATEVTLKVALVPGAAGPVAGILCLAAGAFTTGTYLLAYDICAKERKKGTGS